MKQRIIFTIIIVFVFAVFFAVFKKPKETIKEPSYPSFTEKAMSSINYNQVFLMKKLKIKEKPARGAAEKLNAVGCQNIKKIEELDDSQNAYSMTLIDEENNCFYLTMSYEGYLGTVKDQNGNFLITPID